MKTKASAVEELSDEELSRVAGAMSLADISKAYESYTSALTSAVSDMRAAAEGMIRSMRG